MNFVRSFGFLILGSAVFSSFRATAQPIAVPNFSFELPNTVFVDTTMVDWQKTPEADYWPAIQGQVGYSWDQITGVFLDTNPYANHDGTQAGYILSFPGVGLYQDYSTTPDFNATYNVGRSYDLTVGVFGKSDLAPGSTLALSLYYRDNLNNMVTIGSTTITYAASLFPTNAPLNLVDFTVSLPTVQVSDAWAGQHIGIELLSTTPLEQSSGRNWDIDNVRLTETPEPAVGTLGLLAVALVGMRNRIAGRRT
jgi:hypothetical protein